MLQKMKHLNRLVTLLLVPCLIADPVLAASFEGFSNHLVLNSDNNLFLTEALTAAETHFEQRSLTVETVREAEREGAASRGTHSHIQTLERAGRKVVIRRRLFWLMHFAWSSQWLGSP